MQHTVWLWGCYMAKSVDTEVSRTYEILLIGSQVISKVCFLLGCEGAALMCQVQ